MIRNTAWSSSVPGRSTTWTSCSSRTAAPERSAKAWRAAGSRPPRPPPLFWGWASASARLASSSWARRRPSSSLPRRAVAAKPPAIRRTRRTAMKTRIVARVLTRLDYSNTPDGLQQHAARREVGSDLALDPLQRVVDGLRVAPDPLADVLVAVPVEVQRQHAGLELRQRGGQAAHEGAELLGGDHLVDRVVHRRPRDDLVERRLAVGRAGGRLRERDVLVERRVPVAGGGLS